MSFVPDPGSLDAETFKPIQYRIEGDEEWREIRELELLEAYRESKIPSSTLFRRGDHFAPRTLATLMNWNGRECPFADFSEPEKREGARESKRSDAGTGSAIDENQNCVNSNVKNEVKEEGTENEGGTGDKSVLLKRIIAFMDQIQDRLTSIEQLLTEQQGQINGADIFIKKVASQEARMKSFTADIKMLNKRTLDMNEFVLFGNDAALYGRSSESQPTDSDGMKEIKKMHADFVVKSEHIAEYKEDVLKVCNQISELTSRVKELEGQYPQLVAMLAAHERNKDVQEALQEWKAKQGQKSTQLGFGSAPNSLLTPMPKDSTAISSISKMETLDWRSMQDRADRTHQLQVEEAQQQRAQKVQERRQGSKGGGGGMRISHTASNPIVDNRLKGLLEGRDFPENDKDGVASPYSIQQLSQMGIDLQKQEGAKLSDIMGNPRFICFCGSNLQSGQAIITHFNSKSSGHPTMRPKSLLQSDVDFWTNVLVKLKKNPYGAVESYLRNSSVPVI